MIKLLLTSSLLIDALQNKENSSATVLNQCKKEDKIQAWILGNTIPALLEAGIGKDEIQSALQGISTIPVNAKLTQEALASTLDFNIALLQAAATAFKLQAVVSLQQLSELESLRISPDQFSAFMQRAQSINRIDFLDLKAPLHSIFDQVDGWYMEIIQNTAFAGGNHVNSLEEEFAQFCQTKHAAAVSNGTDALRLILLAMGIGQGDEVITVPNTFIATTEAISQTGATPIFVDVLPDTYNMNPDLIEAKITEKTKVILPVHLYGQIADMDPILAIAKKHGLKVVEDACQAHGAEYKGKRAGSIGDAGAFSMYPGKNMGAFGEAGAIATNDPEIAKMAKCLRDHGQAQKYYHDYEGYNGRMDNLQAAPLRAKLVHLDQWNAKRQQVAQYYTKHLSNCPQVILPKVPEHASPVFHLYVVLVDNPQELHEYLKEKSVFTGFHYPVPLHLQKAYAHRNEEKGSYPVTENAADHLLSLPMFPELEEAQIEHIATLIKQFFAAS